MIEEIIIVDENDKVIGYKEREKAKAENIYRVSVLWIRNSLGQSLLARRALIKRNNPWKWGPAVAGTVSRGESYYENIIREAKEELGLENIKPIKGHKSLDGHKGYRHFTQWYFLTINDDKYKFTIQEDEVAEVKWFSKDEFLSQLEENPEIFLPTAKKWMPFFKKH